MIRRFLRPEIYPFVDVERVQAPKSPIDAVPAWTLPTLADVHQHPRAQPKIFTKLERAIARKADRLEDAKQLRVWARAVKDRDQWRDRKTGARLRRTMDLDPLRAEAHHLVSRDERSLRYDVRNGITLSLLTHLAVERHQYRIEGTVFFSVNGTKHIDANYPVTFVRL